MLRKLALPIVAAALMAGCATTAPYGYQGGGRGDYYYGQPSVEYRYHGAYPGYYGYPYYGGPYRPGFYGSYRYGYPYGYYGRPYYGHPYYRPIYRPRPDNRPDGSPWRNLGELQRHRHGGNMPAEVAPSNAPSSMPMRPAEPRMRGGEAGSRMGEMIRRAREGGRPSSAQDE